MQHDPHPSQAAPGAADTAHHAGLSDDEAALARRLGVNGLSRREFLALLSAACPEQCGRADRLQRRRLRRTGS